MDAAADPIQDVLDRFRWQLGDASPAAEIASVDLGIGADLVLRETVVPQLHLHSIGYLVQASVTGVEQ